LMVFRLFLSVGSDGTAEVEQYSNHHGWGLLA
jgi:hypothetical protein